jgi:hypothetical protein
MATAARKLTATRSACVNNDPYVIASPVEVTTATFSGVDRATDRKRSASPSVEFALLPRWSSEGDRDPDAPDDAARAAFTAGDMKRRAR